MKTPLIEWKHLDRDGQTCSRCDNTGTILRAVIDRLNRTCGMGSTSFQLTETRLPVNRLAESNSILVNGAPIEALLPKVRVPSTECNSCSDLTGEEAACHAIEAEGQTHETLPAELIRTALCQAAGCCDESCDCGCGCESKTVASPNA